MADVIKCATRDAYGNALKALGQREDILVLDADLAKATKTGVFKKEYPDKFIDPMMSYGVYPALRKFTIGLNVTF